MGPRLVDVTGLLDRLAVLGQAGVDVDAVLDRAEREDLMGDRDLVPVSMRVPAALLAEADELAELLKDCPEAQAAGGHWGRSAVLRLALLEGLRRLRRRTSSPGRGDA
jgi:hypothetical protein